MGVGLVDWLAGERDRAVRTAANVEEHRVWLGRRCRDLLQAGDAELRDPLLVRTRSRGGHPLPLRQASLERASRLAHGSAKPLPHRLGWILVEHIELTD